jgi:hypothetical protein
MAQGLYSYPGVLAPRLGVYTQRRGVNPDTVYIEFVPQSQPVSNAGTVIMSYEGDELSVVNCTIDAGRRTYSGNGWLQSVVLADRRELWKYVVPINGHYNETDGTGARVTDTEKTLRELMELLLDACGETNNDVTAVDNTVYPEVDWQCVEPRLALQELCKTWGYDVVLGFDDDPVTIVQMGVGLELPASTDSKMMVSDEIDATIQPQYIRVCFGPSVAQARFELEAVGFDTDGDFKIFDDLSYKPTAGWGEVDPWSLEQARSSMTDEEWWVASNSMYMIYRVKQFSDGDLLLPDGGSTTLDDIKQVLPLDSRLLSTANVFDVLQREQAKLYGIMYREPDEEAQPPEEEHTDIDDELQVQWQWIDQGRGLLRFEKPMWQVVTREFQPASLYVEATFRIRDNTNHQFWNYIKDIEFDPQGYGYATVNYPQARAETIVAYTTGHEADTGNNTTNESELDTLAASIAVATAGRFAQLQSGVSIFNRPRFELRLDGAISEVTHVMSCGDNATHPGSYSIGARNMEYDRTLLSQVEREAISSSIGRLAESAASAAIAGRRLKGND